MHKGIWVSAGKGVSNEISVDTATGAGELATKRHIAVSNKSTCEPKAREASNTTRPPRMVARGRELT